MTTSTTTSLQARENWITPASQYNALCLSWARKIISEMPIWVSSSFLSFPSGKPHSFSFPAICLIAEYAPYEPATDWYLTLQKLAPIIPGLLDQTIPPLRDNIINFLESPCPVYGKPHITKETHVLTLFSKEFGSLMTRQKIFAQYAQCFLPNEKPFTFTSFRKKLSNSTISSTYWGLQTIEQIPVESFNWRPKPNWTYQTANLTERFVAFATHTIALREKFRKNHKNPINFGPVKTGEITTEWRSVNSSFEDPFIIKMSTSRGIEISEFRPGSDTPRPAVIIIFH